MQRSIYAAFLSFLFVGLALAAVRGNHAMYVGGTESGVPDRTMGHFDTSGKNEAVFTSNNKKVHFAIPFSTITSVEYGQKAGRRLGVALAVSPIFLLSHKRRHFLTIQFKDSSGTSQGVVIELSKGDVRKTLADLSSKSQIKVQYESEEARKYANKQ